LAKSTRHRLPSPLAEDQDNVVLSGPTYATQSDRRGSAPRKSSGRKRAAFSSKEDFEPHDEEIDPAEDEDESLGLEDHDEAFGYLHDRDRSSDDSEIESSRSSDNTDDPVRMYLMQMGQIPLLTRPQELIAAKEIEGARILYRHRMLATDYVLQGAASLLEQVRDSKLRLDRTIEVSVTNTSEKKRIMLRIGPNLVTLRRLLQRKPRRLPHGGQQATPVRATSCRLAATRHPTQQGRAPHRRDEPADQSPTAPVRKSGGDRQTDAGAQGPDA
jgi:hypothetical protein